MKIGATIAHDQALAACQAAGHAFPSIPYDRTLEAKSRVTTNRNHRKLSHPLWAKSWGPASPIKKYVDGALRDLPPLFDDMYADLGRPSIPPERLLKCKVLMALFTIRSERLLVEQIGYNLLYR